jgi:hypothetical protein
LTSSGGSSPKNLSVKPRKRFVLAGRSASLDRRRDVVRDDLADIAMADRVFAPHYAVAQPRQLATDATLRIKPVADAEVMLELTSGATVDVFDISGGWAWCRTHDTVGYITTSALAAA